MAVRVDVVAAMVAKDLRLFARDRFYVLVTAMGLVFFVGLFWVLPSSVETTIPIGLHLGGVEPVVDQVGEEGLEITLYTSDTLLREAITDRREVVAGLSFPAGFEDAVRAGEPVTVHLYLAGDAPEGLSAALSGMTRGLVGAVTGERPPVSVPSIDEMVLGVDRSDDPIALRDQMRPLLIFSVLMVEMLALASLVATEISQRTVTAVLVTPARVTDVLIAKAVLGSSLAFGQVAIVALVTGTLASSPALVIVTLVLGALLVTGFGLISGSIGQDFVAIVFWSMLFFVPLLIPAFAVLFPGTPDLWVRVLPSYGLVEILVRVIGYGDGLSQVWAHLAALAAWCVAAFAAGTFLLARRVARV